MAEQKASFQGRLENFKGRMFNYRRVKETRENENENENKDAPTTEKGGFITIFFILVNEAFQKVVSYGLLSNMVLYLTKEYRMTTAKANHAMFFWNATTDLLALLCGFISDSYTGRFSTIGFGSVSSLLGTFLLWLTTIIPKLKPPRCTDPSTRSCRSPTTAQLTYLFSTFSLISIGAGCVSSSTAFGVDQFKPKDKRSLERYFMYYYASSSFLLVITATATAHMLDKFGWEKGFRFPLILVVLFVITFFLRSPRYFKEKPEKDLLTSFAQVIVAAFRNRSLSLPPTNSIGRYLPKKNSKIVVPSDNLRFLNKACLIRNPEEDIAPDWSAVNPWTLCTIEQVEELKAVAKVAALLSTGVMLWVTVSKPKFMLLQAGIMNRQISDKFEIPRGTFAAFSIIVMLMGVLLYDHVVIPLGSKIKGEPIHIGVKSRMGIGLFLSAMAMVTSAVVESIRREKAITEGSSDDMSAMWLLPQHCLIGLAQAFTIAGQLEFVYTELPRSMSSVAVALLEPGMAVASLLSDAVSNAVLDLSSKGGEEMAWTDIDKAPLHYYYWALAIMSCINLLYFCLCSRAYGPCGERCEDNGAELDGAELDGT
ncbi:hypothetical protein SLEP1_g36274 [Rubroshorea leprosula]|uniref:Protein NRT1/ PTR FAMILY 1.2-like n=1 Tax=Rubroshorea leprosula TaxID=152421 RepID=A0AAV5KR37_9ROSI|nr:hypothetical protein SLEP1_g36274 [Rubroshorea leprosula]